VVQTRQDVGRWVRRWQRGLGVIDAAGFRPLAGPAAEVWAASPDGRLVAWATGDTVRTLDLIGGGQTALDPGVGPVAAVAVAPDGLRLAAAGPGAVAVWDVDG
jgi:hypothetical protein